MSLLTRHLAFRLRPPVTGLPALLGAVLVAVSLACAPITLGRKVNVDPQSEIKVGHDRKEDVLRKMGAPYRRAVDSAGREMFTYVWADGKGNGDKVVIAFNENDVVYLVESAP